MRVVRQFQVRPVYFLSTAKDKDRMREKDGERDTGRALHRILYIHQIGATVLWLRLTLQQSPSSVSIHPSPLLSQSYRYTVCQARWSAVRSRHVPLGFNTPLTNPPPNSRWHAMPGSSATGGLRRYQWLKWPWVRCACVCTRLFQYSLCVFVP